MADKVSREERSRIMAQVKAKNTAPELKVRKALHAAGYRFRLHRKDLPGHPDIVLPRYRMAVFIHGCFWHGHDCSSFRLPKTNKEYWVHKITRNKMRDAQAVKDLDSMGWRTQIIWECALEEGIRELLVILDAERTKVKSKKEKFTFWI